jgi:hypothetical protein
LSQTDRKEKDMFVKVVKFNKSNVEEGTGHHHISTGVTSIYQCGQARFRLVDRATKEGTEKDLMIEMEGCPAPHNDFFSVQCERKQLSVFIMNDAGKTIDSYNYS